MRLRLLSPGTVLALGLITLLSACGGDDDTSDTTLGAADTTAVATDTTDTPATEAASDTAATTGVMAAIVERGTLRVGVGIYAPTAIQDTDGTFRGVDIDVTAGLAERLGVDIEYIPVGYDIIAAGVQTGRYDMTTTIVETPERGEAVTFSDPLYSVDQLYMVLADAPYQTLDDLNNPDVTIINTVGSYDEVVRQTYIPESTSNAVAGFSIAQQLAEVVSGRADAMNVETPFTTARLQDQFGDEVRFIPGLDEEALESSPVSYGLPLGDAAFEAYVNEYLTELRDAGTIDELFDQYTDELLGAITE